MPGIMGKAGWDRARACTTALFVDAVDDCCLGRVEVEPDNVVHLVHEQRVV